MFLVHALFICLHLASGKHFFAVSDLHLDIHYDPHRSSQGFCHSRPMEGFPESPPTSDVQVIGRHFCDSSERLLRTVLSQMQTIDPVPDFILVTGDMVGHFTSRMLNSTNQLDPVQNNQDVLDTITTVFELFEEFFPDVLVIPALGNNDGYTDYHIPTDPEYLAKVLQASNQPLPAEFLRRGYYYLETPVPAIVLNSNYFSVYSEGVWTEAAEQLVWLEETLQLVEEQVLVTMHIPPGISMYRFGEMQWALNETTAFQQILVRHRAKIWGVLAGHLHGGFFQLMPNTNFDISIIPAVSPIFGNNPMFRHYTETEGLMDFVDYSYSFSDNNWKEQYRYSHLFGLPMNWKEAFAQLSRNQTILDQFVAHTYGLREEANPATKFSNLLFHHEISEITRQAVLCAFSQVNFLAYSYCLKRSAATYPSNEY